MRGIPRNQNPNIERRSAIAVVGVGAASRSFGLDGYLAERWPLTRRLFLT
jgi:hypothetical protein